MWQAEIELRQDVKKLLDTRRTYRRGRRNRKTRYRRVRFLNRVGNYRKVSKWLPPSVNQKVQHNINWINRIYSLLPKTQLMIEVGKFDMAKMQNPEIKGVAYQQGDVYGYENVKYYCLDRDRYTCQVCGKHGHGIKLKIHHIIYRHLGGTNRASNLLTVCSECHTQTAHKQGGKLYELMKRKVTKSESYQGTTFMNILRQRLFIAFPSEKYSGRCFTYGYKTVIARNQLGLSKSHFNDAVAITGSQAIKEQLKQVIIFKQFRKKKRSLHEATARKGRKQKNSTSKRNKKNTKSIKDFQLNDKVQLANGFCGFITGFTELSAYVQDIFGNYLQLSEKYKQNSLSKLVKINSNNNWQQQTIKMTEYHFR